MEKILFAASECMPFIKTGGLADVIGALPKYFDKTKFEVRVVLPKYSCINSEYKERMKYKTHFYMDLSWRRQYVGIQEMEHEGILYYFIDNEFYFTGDHPYGDGYWDMEKFAFFSKAALSFLPLVDFQPDVIHCHDWQIGLVPVFLKEEFQKNDFFQNMRTIMTIHNLKFQGIWDIFRIKDITGLKDHCFTREKLEFYGDANYLKGGIVYSDFITTVSKSYGEEIKTLEYGEGLEGVLKARESRLLGIVNGIDYDLYNPKTDRYISKVFDRHTFEQGKAYNKKRLQKKVLLEEKEVFLIGIVSRLTGQKGIDLIAHMMDQLCQLELQIVVLGTGEKKHEEMFQYFSQKYKGKVSVNLGYSESLAHEIYAACDSFLMPSLFEPCGLSQLISLRYGTVPLVRETGGLKDTIEPYNKFEETGTGFGFQNYNAYEMFEMIKDAYDTYTNHRSSWNKIIIRDMEQDFSWSDSAKKYELLYKKLLQ